MVRLEFEKSAWFVPALLLNVLFLGTSHALSYLPFQFWAFYVFVTANLATPFQRDIQTFYDVASLSLTFLIAVLGYLAFHGGGPKRTLLRIIQLCSGSFIPLGFEIFLFDYQEWNMNFARFQVTYNILPWFTNGDLFFLVTSMFALATLLSSPLPRLASLGKGGSRRGGQAVVAAAPPEAAKRAYGET